jgi:UDP-N-acetyl-D-glucosamine dehydrogenase
VAPSASSASSLEKKIRDRDATIGVIGLGYVGLPLIHAFIEGGFNAIGYDIDQAKIDMLMQGQSYISHIPEAWLEKWLSEKKFLATADPQQLSNADAILICVPTPLTETRDPDLSYVVSSVQMIAKVLRKGQLVVLESTTYPGTTRDVSLPILEKTGLKVEQDFFLAYSPEREDPGNKQFSAAKIPKVVGGIGPNSKRIAEALYSSVVVDVVSVSSCETAELCKILENTYRAVNIALVNELKLLCQRMGVDVWEVIDAAKSKPFGFQAFYPGPGLGGHCIPIDPFYLTWIARKYGMSTRFVELAGEVNSSMPEHVVQRLSLALNEAGKPVRGSKVVVLGLAYKKDVDDTRESPSLELMEQLIDMGAAVTYSDPYVPKMRRLRHYDFPGMVSQELTPEFLKSQDCVLLATDHSGFDYEHIAKHASLIIDTRNAFKNVKGDRKHIVKA